MTVDFSGALAKFERAEEHLRAFETEVRTYIESKPIVLDSKSNANGSREDFYIRLVNPIPQSLGLILGDCVHNFRSVLDHIAMSLAIDNGTDPYDSTVYFPICGTPERFFGDDHVGDFKCKPPGGSGRSKIGKLSHDAQAFIERMQPYNGGAQAASMIELQNLDNWDKHRAVVPHFFNQLFQQNPMIPGVSVEWVKTARMEDGAHMATVNYPPDYSGMKVQPPFVAGISVERVNKIGFLVVPDFIQKVLVDRIRGIWSEAERLFGFWSGDV